MWAMFHLEYCEGLVQHVQKELGRLGFNNLYFVFSHNISDCEVQLHVQQFVYVWCTIKFGHHLTHIYFIDNHCPSWG